jgi:hypothetical protein
MGWCGHGLYAGDGTQSCHCDFLEQMGISDDYDEVFEWMSMSRTTVPKDRRHLLRKNYKLAVDKMPKMKFCFGKRVNEDDMLEWQMLLSLFVDNLVKPPKIIADNGIKATQYLLGDHASDFDNPGARRSSLKAFLKRVEKTINKKK